MASGLKKAFGIDEAEIIEDTIDENCIDDSPSNQDEYDNDEIVIYQDSKIVNIPENNTNEDDEEDDIKFAKKSLKELMNRNDDAMEDLIAIAKSSEHPRAYEVYGQLVKTQADLIKTLLDTKKISNQIDKTNNVDQETKNINVTQNNVMFNGSTNDLLKLINSSMGNNKDA